MKNLLFFILAITLFCVLFPVAIIYNFLDWTFSLMGRLAIAIDKAGNILLDNILNDLAIPEDGHKFGNGDETISYVLGANKELKPFGRWLCGILNLIEKDHCINAYNRTNSKHL